MDRLMYGHSRDWPLVPPHTGRLQSEPTGAIHLGGTSSGPLGQDESPFSAGRANRNSARSDLGVQTTLGGGVPQILKLFPIFGLDRRCLGLKRCQKFELWAAGSGITGGPKRPPE